jgi:ribosome biogenesis GTPase / thiamine phosphate phosphatase
MRKLFRNINNSFICASCGQKVPPLTSGGHNRNHCPFCLSSLHVDDSTPGDRLSGCRGLMIVVSVETRRTGEYVLIHKCEICGKISKNRIAGDDDFDKVIALTEKINI